MVSAKHHYHHNHNHHHHQKDQPWNSEEKLVNSILANCRPPSVLFYSVSQESRPEFVCEIPETPNRKGLSKLRNLTGSSEQVQVSLRETASVHLIQSPFLPQFKMSLNKIAIKVKFDFLWHFENQNFCLFVFVLFVLLPFTPLLVYWCTQSSSSSKHFDYTADLWGRWGAGMSDIIS